MSRLHGQPGAYHHGHLRTAVLEHVRLIIREQGVSVVSIREVARRTQVSHAAPSHHFGNKAGLLTAFAIQGYDLLADTVKADLAATGAATPPDVLAVMGQAYVRFALENPEHFGVMFPGELVNQDDPEYLRATNRCYGPLMSVVSQGSAEGTLAADARLVATSAWSLVHGLASLWLSGRIQERTGATDAPALARAVTELFVDRMLRKTKPKAQSSNPKSQNPNPNVQTPNSKPQNPKAKTQHPKPTTRHPKPRANATTRTSARP